MQGFLEKIPGRLVIALETVSCAQIDQAVRHSIVISPFSIEVARCPSERLPAVRVVYHRECEVLETSCDTLRNSDLARQGKCFFEIRSAAFQITLAKQERADAVNGASYGVFRSHGAAHLERTVELCACTRIVSQSNQHDAEHIHRVVERFRSISFSP